MRQSGMGSLKWTAMQDTEGRIDSRCGNKLENGLFRQLGTRQIQLESLILAQNER